MRPTRRLPSVPGLTVAGAMIAAAPLIIFHGSAECIAPGHLTDEDLAQLPLVVVARWNRAPFERHHRVEQNALKDYDLRTRIEVVRVLKGDLRPGEYTVMLGPFIGWEEKGGRVMSYTSTELAGDAEEVLEPNLWFMTRKRTWDTTDTTEYLHLPHHRCIQPTELEPFYVALGSGQSRQEVPRLLASDHTEVVRRTLLHICGGVWPWPNDDSFQRTYLSPRNPGERLIEQRGAVVRLVERGDAKLASLAASVYAELAAEAGEDGVPKMREWLRNGDPRVRAVAMGILARQRDRSSIEEMVKAVKGMEDPWLSSRVIECLDGWAEVSLVPVLISFLEDDGFAGLEGDDFKVPALKARSALHSLTGRWFPFDTDLSRRAWEEAIGPRSGPAPPAIPVGLLPYKKTPFEAGLIKDGKRTLVRVRNGAEVPVALAKRPSEIEYRWDGGISSTDFTTSAKEDDFQVLAPGESIRFEVNADPSFLRSRERKATLMYLKTGRAFGFKAWIGPLDVDLGESHGDEK